jgi:CheY-like chemotaxis protein
MQSGVVISDETIINGIDIHAYLHKPFSQQMILSVIINLYSEKPNYHELLDKSLKKEDLQSLRGSHIYLVEDNKINQTVMLALLDGTGINVTVFENGQELLDQLTINSNIDLILMDIYMPIMNGYQVTKEIRTNSEYDHIPIIALTASAMQKDIDRALEAGMTAYISKPIHVQTLYTLLLEHIRERSIIEISEILQKQETQKRSLQLFKNFYTYTLAQLEEDINKLHKDEVLKLLINIKEEAQKTDVDRFDTIDQEFEKIVTTRDDALNEHLKVYNEMLEVYLISIAAIRENKLTTDREKNYVSKVLNVDAGIAYYQGDAKLYRSHLFAFEEYLNDSSGLLEPMIAQSQLEDIASFALKLKEASEKIKANIMINLAISFEMILSQYKSEVNEFLQTYKQISNTAQEQ